MRSFKLSSAILAAAALLAVTISLGDFAATPFSELPPELPQPATARAPISASAAIDGRRRPTEREHYSGART